MHLSKFKKYYKKTYFDILLTITNNEIFYKFLNEIKQKTAYSKKILVIEKMFLRTNHLIILSLRIQYRTKQSIPKTGI